MLLAGIQAKFGLDPRLKHSGVTVLGVASLDPSGIFDGGRGEHRSFFAAFVVEKCRVFLDLQFS
jgi:hypothetical protein